MDSYLAKPKRRMFRAGFVGVLMGWSSFLGVPSSPFCSSS